MQSWEPIIEKQGFRATRLQMPPLEYCSEPWCRATQIFKVLLTAKDRQWVHSLSAAFEESPQFEVIENHDPLLILEKTGQILPEVSIWRTNGEDEESLLKVINECPQVMLVLVVDDPNRFDITRLMHAGVSGCLPVRLLPRQIVATVELIVITGIFCFPRLNKGHLSPSPAKSMTMPTSLTLREREILALLCHNHSNQEIAAAMCLSESTVKTHLHNIFRKMGIKKRSEAIAAVYQNGMALPVPDKQGSFSY
jgi:DNA-binding NarL/FixJ family response regulator